MSDTHLVDDKEPHHSWLRGIFEFVSVAVIGFLLFHPQREMSYFSVFQARDLDRARELIAGHPIFFGPETSGGGNLPGGFYYLLLSIPLRIGLGWKGVWSLAVAMNALALAVLWTFTRRYFGWVVACLGLALYLTSRLLTLGLWRFENPSYLPLFVALGLVGNCMVFARGGPSRFLWWCLTCFILGLGIQEHFTIFFMLLPALLIQWQNARLKLSPLPRREFLLGLVFFAVPLLPNAAWLLARVYSFPFGQSVPDYVGSFHRTCHFLSNVLAIELHRKNSVLDFIVECFHLVGTVVFPGRAAFAVFVFLAGWWMVRLRRGSVTSLNSDFRQAMRDRCVTVLGVCVAVNLPCAFTYLATLHYARYAEVFAVALSLFLAVFLQRVLITAIGKWWFLLLFALVLATDLFPSLAHLQGTSLRTAAPGLICLAAFLAILVVRQPRLSSMPQSLAWIALLFLYMGSYFGSLEWRHARIDFPGYTIGETEQGSRQIHAQTGWSYDLAKDRIFYVNGNVQLTPRYVYEEIQRRSAVRSAASSLDVDGFFWAAGAQEAGSTAEELRRWLLDQGLEVSLLRGLKAGGIELGPGQRISPSVVLFPYRVLDREHYPRYFQNKGDAYGFAQTKILNDLSKADKAANRSILALFNDCPNREPYCRIGILARSKDLTDPSQTVQVEILGACISQPSMWICPDWSQAVTRPFISFHCADQWVRVNLADSIGFYGTVEKFNQSFLAPYEREFRPGCRGPVSELEIGYESSQVIRQMNHLNLDGQRSLFELGRIKLDQ